MKKLLASIALLLMVFAPLAIAAEDSQKSAARQDLQSARADWQQSIKDFQDAKGSLEDARKTRNETRNQTRDDLIGLKKTLLTKLVDRVIAHIDLAEAWANNLKLDDSTKASIVATLEDEKSKLEAEKTVISGITTTADLKTEVQKIRGIIQDTRHAIKIAVAQLLGNRTQNLIDNAQKLSDRLDAKMTELQAKGVDTSSADSLIADFKAKIDSAKDLADQADAKFNSALTDTTNAEQLVKDGRQLLKQSHDALKSARDDLKKIVAQLRSLKVKPEDVGAQGEE